MYQEKVKVWIFILHILRYFQIQWFKHVKGILKGSISKFFNNITSPLQFMVKSLLEQQFILQSTNLYACD